MKGLNLQAVERLQAEIDREVNNRNDGRIERVVLDHGSEVTDLTRCADVRVFSQRYPEFRIFSFCEISFLNDVLSSGQHDHPRPDARGLYSCGGPLIVAREITGSAIIRGILYYLDQEDGRDGL